VTLILICFHKKTHEKSKIAFSVNLLRITKGP
jgi:hypothetical protein